MTNKYSFTVSDLPMMLRRATADDKEAMLRVMRPHRNGYFPGKLDTRRVRVAMIGEEVVGFVGWERDQVQALYVAEAWRSKRLVGPALLATAECAIRDAGHQQVKIMIDAHADRAHHFYQKHDYETVSDPRQQHIVWMTKRL